MQQVKEDIVGIHAHDVHERCGFSRCTELFYRRPQGLQLTNGEQLTQTNRSRRLDTAERTLGAFASLPGLRSPVRFELEELPRCPVREPPPSLDFVKPVTEDPLARPVPMLRDVRSWRAQVSIFR